MTAMSRNKSRPLISLAKKCECCGKLVVLLRRSDAPTGQIRHVAVYLRSWDGNPWFNSTVHTKHPPKRYAKHMSNKRGGGGDPFFSLD